MAEPGVSAVDIAIAPGAAVASLPEGDRYLGFVFASGPDADAVEGSLRAAMRHLTVQIRPDGRIPVVGP